MKKTFRRRKCSTWVNRLSPAKRKLFEARLVKSRPTTSSRNPSTAADSGLSPASFAQQRFWFLDRLDDHPLSLHCPAALRLTGPIDVAMLRRSLDAIYQRHEVYRMQFEVYRGEPMVAMAPEAKLELPLDDLSALDKTQRQAHLQRLLDNTTRQRFDLAKAPLARQRLVRLGADEHVLIHVAHHTIFDRTSIKLLIDELAALYRAHIEGDGTLLPQLPVAYRDFSASQRNFSSDSAWQQSLQFWRDHLGNSPPVLELPSDRPRPPRFSNRGTRRAAVLDQAFIDELRHFSHQQSVTLFTTMLTAFYVLLHRYSEQNDLIVGVPVAGRNRRETEQLIGVFTNQLPIRVELDDCETFIALLGKVNRIKNDCLAHQNLPFEQLVRQLNIERDLSRPTLCQVALNYFGQMLPAPTAGGVQFEHFRPDSGGAAYDLMLDLRAQPNGMSMELEFNTDIFDAGRMDRMLGHFETLLRGVLTDPAQRTSKLPLLTETERRQLVTDFNAASAACQTNVCLHQLFEAQAEASPDTVALVCGTQRVSYAALNGRANRMAHHLRERGVGPNALVGVCMKRSTDMVAAILAVLKAGGAYLPLDPAYPRKRIEYLLQHSGARLVIGETSLQAMLPAETVENIFIDNESNAISAHSSTNPTQETRPSELAYVIYTSGSTGQPKGVAIEHRTAVAMIQWGIHTLSSQQREGVLFSTSICFDPSVLEIFVPLCAGSKMIVVDNALALADAPAAEDVTFIQTVPSAMSALIRLRAVPQSVKLIALGGETLPATLARQCNELPGKSTLINLYGPTEDTVWSTCATIVQHGDRPPPIGKPIAGSKAYIVDPFDQPVPIGVPGELCIGGAKVARGYHRRPDLTVERFVADPFHAAGKTMYRTGDRARWNSNGDIELLGRLDDQLKIRGFRIEPGEIEAVINRHPQVQRCIVLGRDGASLVAYITAAGDQEPCIDEIKELVVLHQNLWAK